MKIVSSVSRQFRRALSLMSFGVKGAPISLGILAIMWIAGLVGELTVDDWHRFVGRNLAVGIVPFEDVHLWTPLTAGFLANGAVGLVTSTLLILLVAAPIEHRIGFARMGLSALITQVGGTLLGLGSAALAKTIDESWGFRLHVGLAVGPTTWIVGSLMAASAGMSTLWRRRVRMGTFALLIVLALFGGHLQDVIRLAAAVVGVVIGPSIVGRSPRRARLMGTQREGRVLVALVVAASALGPMLAALSPDAIGPFAVLRELFRASPLSVTDVRDICSENASSVDCRRGLLELRLSGVGPTILSVMPSIFLLVVSDGVRRGRRGAWLFAVVGQIVLILMSAANFAVRYLGSSNSDSIFYGLESPNFYRTVIPFLTPVAVLAMLLITRRFFDVSAPTGTYRRLWAKVVAVVVGSAAIYVIGGLIAGSGFDPRPNAASLLIDFPRRLVPPVYLQWLDPTLLPDSVVSTVLYEWVGVVFWVVVCVAVAATFVKPAYGAETQSAERARQLLSASGGSALSWMTTWRGNRYWFAPDGRSFVAFRVIAGVALTTGDPVGPASRRKDAVQGFAEFASINGWIPCFYSVTADVRAITDDLGWTAIQVAEETVLPLGELAFTGKKFQDVRTAVNRAKKAGVEAEWISFGTAPLAITDQITAISEEWVADKGMPEMGFTLGGLEEIDDPQVRCLIAVDEHRTVHGVTSWMPVFEDGLIVGWTLDFMRRRSEGFRPAMEFLIASAAMLLQEEGVKYLSLSGAPLAKIADDTGARENDVDGSALGAALERLLDVLGRTLEPVYGFRSLLAFKSKFQPQYEPMFMTFADPAALPSIGNAIGRAYLPDVSFGQSVRLVRTLIDR